MRRKPAAARMRLNARSTVDQRQRATGGLRSVDSILGLVDRAALLYIISTSLKIGPGKVQRDNAEYARTSRLNDAVC